MNAHPILLQMKYTRIVELFAKRNGCSLAEALDFFITRMCICSCTKAWRICTA